MSQTLIALSAITTAWIVYFLIHSALASLHVKAWVGRRWPRLQSRYRLIYNILALLLLLPIFWLLHQHAEPVVWRWQGSWRWLSHAAALIAIVGFVWSLRYYNIDQFLGLGSKTVSKDVAMKIGLRISPLHRFVRHPWYFFALILLWTRDMNAGFLTSAAVITIYFLIGSRLEENKLIAEYGEVYRRYRRLVPALIPLPWRVLDRNTAIELERDAAGQTALLSNRK